MGSPGVFIHSGTLGGRLSALSLAPSTWLPARPPPLTAPPTNAPPSRRNRRRDVAAISLSMSVGFVIVRAARQPLQADPRITLQKLPRLKAGSLSASTSALTLPNVVSGLCLMLSQNAWMMSSLNCADARAPPPHVPRHCIRHRPAP